MFSYGELNRTRQCSIHVPRPILRHRHTSNRLLVPRSITVASTHQAHPSCQGGTAGAEIKAPCLDNQPLVNVPVFKLGSMSGYSPASQLAEPL